MFEHSLFEFIVNISNLSGPGDLCEHHLVMVQRLDDGKKKQKKIHN